MYKSVTLENFFDTPEEDTSEDAFLEGVLEGRRQAQEEGELALARTIDKLNQSLADITFTYAEARHNILLALTPLFEALAHKMLPSISQEIALSHIAEWWISTAKTDSQAPLTLYVNPELIAGLEEHANFYLPTAFTFQPSPDMPLDKIHLAISDAQTSLDLTTLTKGLQSALLAPTLLQAKS